MRSSGPVQADPAQCYRCRGLASLREPSSPAAKRSNTVPAGLPHEGVEVGQKRGALVSLAGAADQRAIELSEIIDVGDDVLIGRKIERRQRCRYGDRR